MGIKVDHSPVGAIGVAGLISGQGWLNRYNQEMNQRWNIEQARLQAQRDSQLEQLRHQEQRDVFLANNQAERDKYLAQNQLARDDVAIAVEDQRAERDFGHTKELRGIDLENYKQQQDYQYTQKQKYDLQKLANERAAIEEAYPIDSWIVDEVDPELLRQRNEALKQWNLKKAGIGPPRMPIDPSESIDSQFKKRVKYDEARGVMHVLQPDGKWDTRPLPKKEQPKTAKDSISVKDLMNLRQEAVEKLTKIVEERDPRDPKKFHRREVLPSEEQIVDYIQRGFDLHAQITGRQRPAQMAPSGASNGNRAGARPFYEKVGGTALGDLPVGTGGKQNLPGVVDPNAPPPSVEFLGARDQQSQPTTDVSVVELKEAGALRTIPPEIRVQAEQHVSILLKEMAEAKAAGDVERLKALQQEAASMRAKLAQMAVGQ